MIESILFEIKDKLTLALPQLKKSLNPPASIEEINHVETTIGLKLPESLKSLYLTHNGESGDVGLFFGLHFLTLSELLIEWEHMTEISNKNTEEFDHEITSIPASHIRLKYIDRNSICFAKDFGGNYLALDLSPDTCGKKGQVINTGRDEHDRYVIAYSLNGLFQMILDNIVTGNFKICDDDESTTWVLKDPENTHFLDTLPFLNLPYDS